MNETGYDITYKNFLYHIYVMVRWGKWYIGWTFWEEKPWLGIYHDYYDGHRVAFHFGPLSLEVQYF